MALGASSAKKTALQSAAAAYESVLTSSYKVIRGVRWYPVPLLCVTAGAGVYAALFL